MNTSQPQMNSLPDGDLELLSGYIDNQLGASDRAELERRLGSEPRLRAELEDLRATATLLRGLEPVRPPRSFTLDRATARRRRGFLPFAWAMQLGGGLAGLALVLMASLQMIVGVGGSTAMAPAPPAAMQAPAEAAPLPLATEAAPTAAPAAAAAPMAAAAVAPESTQAPTSAVARQTGPAVDSATNDSDGDGDGDGDSAPGAAAAVPTADIAASGSSSPGTQSLETPVGPPVTKVGIQPAEFPTGLVFGLGVVLLMLAVGSFLYTRSRR